MQWFKYSSSGEEFMKGDYDHNDTMIPSLIIEELQ